MFSDSAYFSGPTPRKARKDDRSFWDKYGDIVLYSILGVVLAAGIGVLIWYFLTQYNKASL